MFSIGCYKHILVFSSQIFIEVPLRLKFSLNVSLMNKKTTHSLRERILKALVTWREISPEDIVPLGGSRRLTDAVGPPQRASLDARVSARLQRN